MKETAIFRLVSIEKLIGYRVSDRKMISAIYIAVEFSFIRPYEQKKEPAPILGTDSVIYYIFSGADTPINFSAFFNVICTACTRARRAFDASSFSLSTTLCAP